MTILRSRRFQKALNRFARSGRKDILHAIHDVISLLMTHDDRSLYILKKRYKDHSLRGNLKGFRELHLSIDDLILYFIIKNEQTVVLDDIVTHEELRKKK